ncbi:MAG: DUF2336 domain-containing protein [Alphaproteobacteria bacterium]|nr:DUF2336 domain-containing protein [Alphaproteobacteria bacterium]
MTPRSNLLELLELAGERSSDRRRELLRRLTDAFVEAPQDFDSRQTGQISDILSTLAREMDVEVRRSLATRIAALPEAPRGLLLELANDEITVARPILTDSLVLTEPDLVARAKLVGQEHLEAIARRGRITTPVTDQLAVRGGDGVLLELINNPGAELTRGTLEIMIARAGQNEALREPLVVREAVPPDLLSGLFFVVSASLKRAIVQRAADLPPELVEEAIRESERRLRRRMPANEPGEPAIRSPAGPITEAQLVKLSREKDGEATAAMLAALAALPPGTAKHLLEDRDAVGLAVVCRACRFERTTFAALALGSNATTRSPAEMNELIALYDRIPATAAQRVVRFWRIRQAGSDLAA